MYWPRAGLWPNIHSNRFQWVRPLFLYKHFKPSLLFEVLLPPHLLFSLSRERNDCLSIPSTSISNIRRMLPLLPPAYLLLHPSFSSSFLYMEGDPFMEGHFLHLSPWMSSLPSSFSIISSHIFILSLPLLILLMFKVKDGRYFSVSTHILAPFFLREAIRSWNMSPLLSTREWLSKPEQKVLKFEKCTRFF